MNTWAAVRPITHSLSALLARAGSSIMPCRAFPYPSLPALGGKSLPRMRPRGPNAWMAIATARLCYDETQTQLSRCDRLQQNTTNGAKELTARQVAALPYLVASPTVSEAAKVAQVDRATLYRWMEDEDFREALSELRSEATDLAKAELKGLMLKSVRVLADAMDDPSPNVRVRAAQTALSIGFRVNELEKVRERLDILDGALPLWAKANAVWSGRGYGR